ncbi:MAG: DUF4783 domain-containing protein [Paludibacter sp.]|nr:DUF4783 domain-containing protein [Paludibacter sp.]
MQKIKKLYYKNKAALVIPIAVLFLFFSQIAASQNNKQSVPDEVIAALNKGDNGRLSARLDNRVSLTIDTQTGTYSAADAKKILSDFFAKNSVENFKIIHQGGSEQSCFVIGNIKTANGSFRVYLLMRGKILVIQQIIIGKEQKEN